MVETSIASGSNGQTLPQTTINVASTTGFAASGSFTISVSGSIQTIAYTGTNAGTQFTGCSGGTGTLATGQGVVQSTDNSASIEFNSARGTPASGILGIPTGASGSYDVVNMSGGKDDHGSTTVARSGTISLPVTPGGSTTKYYQMVGYYTTGAVYEAFVVTGSPSASTATNPNTGHTLTNCYVASFWQV